MNSFSFRLRNLPIRRKLVLVILLTCATVLVLALAAVFAVQWFTVKTQFIGDLSSLGRIVAHNCAAAAAFNDREAAAQTLSGMESRPEIEGACLVLSNGQHVTQVDRHHDYSDAAEESLVQGYRIDGDHILFASSVELDGLRIGTLYLRADFGPTRARLLTLYARILAVVLVASLLVAFALASRLQRFITAPVLHLAMVVAEVGQKGDYRRRATKEANDEVGRLTDAFNAMLSQIQSRDQALQTAQSQLEQRVQERTHELASSLSVLNATLDSTADGIFAVGFDGKVASYNSKFAAMWNLPAEMLARRDSAEMVQFASLQVTDPAKCHRRIEELFLNRGAEAFDVIELKDGRTFERYVQPQRIGGENVGMVMNFRDITQRKLAEASLEAVHKQLLETSRQAGMAEVATSVLHNVGNVLNSVNISAGLVFDHVSRSKATTLGRVVALLQEHASDLAGFVTNHPQGRNVPAFLRQLDTRLTTERESIQHEVTLLRDNIEHIKEIVSMQQEYAKVSGVTELLQVADLVEDSLRMNAAALVRHGVTVEREFQELPAISVEKHKVLQILVNLIRNAKYACDERGHDDKRIKVRVCNGKERVKIAVSDNGIGIPPENLTRIFNHGFTTRKTGHGFGLHSGALAATEMGGVLRVHSEGPGCGATFTLELPHSLAS